MIGSRGVVLSLALAAGVCGAELAHAQGAPANAVGTNPATATLIGRVTDSLGQGVRGAEIGLVGDARLRAITNDSGAFRIDGLAAGSQRLAVRRIGFRSETFTVTLTAARVARITVPLTAVSVALDPVQVSDTVSSHWLDEFEQHRKTDRGTFITRADFVKNHPREASDILRTIPGVRIVPNRLGQPTVTFMRSVTHTCRATMYLEGMPYGGSLDDFTPDDIEALEVYTGISEIPPEFDRNNRGICAVINVWTRDPRRAP